MARNKNVWGTVIAPKLGPQPLPPFNIKNIESSDNDAALPPIVTCQLGRPRKNHTEEERESQERSEVQGKFKGVRYAMVLDT